MKTNLLVLVMALLIAGCQADQQRIDTTESKGGQMAKATFAAGCFWHVQAAFGELEGVQTTAVGYMGGQLANPTYQQVCSDSTGHAEVVEVQYDAERLSYQKLLELFWSIHDPTTPNRQGPDVGSQYRSVIFYHNQTQRQAALAAKEEVAKQGRYKKPIVTEIVPAGDFWRAEDYHQDYFRKQGSKTCGYPPG